jgi:hypothetical protein
MEEQFLSRSSHLYGLGDGYTGHLVGKSRRRKEKKPRYQKEN